MNFVIIYAELEKDYQIVERGIFYSVAEFADYYAKGWRGAAHWNAAAEEYNKTVYATCAPELTDFIDPTGALRKAGLLR